MLIDNIIQNANLENQQYRIFLHKINGELIREITQQCFAISFQVQLGATDIINFSISSYYDKKLVLNYEDIVGRNLIKLQKGNSPIGFFEIQNPSIDNDGIIETKQVAAYSLEIKLINKHFVLPNIEGGYKLVDYVHPEQGILNLLVAKAPSWNIGTVDAELLPKVRIFDEVDTNIYEFLLGDVQKTFECIFEFDTLNRRINAIYLPNYGRTSPIIISLENLANSASIVEQGDQIITRLHLYGQNDLSVRDVNFGQDFIDNFTYYKNTKFMTQSLINALNAYDILVDSKQVEYDDLLSDYVILSAELTNLNSQLSILVGEQEAIDKALGYAIAINDEPQIASLQASLIAKKIQVQTKTGQVGDKTVEMTGTKNQINIILNALKMDLNFTVPQLIELDNFIIEDTYQESSLLITDNMTFTQITNTEKELLAMGIRTLNRASVPRYTITIDVVDFLQLKEFAAWWNELYLGDIIRVNVNDSFNAQIRVSGYTHDWDSNALTITFSDKFALEDASFQLMELVQSGASAGTTIDYEKFKYKEYQNEQNQILNFINGSLDLNKNAVIGGTNQELKMDSSGVLLRRFDTSTQNYSPKQIKLTHNAMVITDNNFDTVKVAIGQLATGQYGIAAEVIAGKLIMGNSLQIQNDIGSLIIDEDGIKTTSFDLDMLSTDNLQNIIIDPNAGIQIRSRATVGGAWTDTLKFDSITKKFLFNGTLQAVNGTFSGALQGGTIGIGGAGYDNFKVDTSGNVTIKQGSMNIGGKFIVDTAGVLTATGANISGNITMGAGSTINWATVSPPTASQVGARPDNWVPTASQVGALPEGTYIPDLPSYIGPTYIDGAQMRSSTITGGTIQTGLPGTKRLSLISNSLTSFNEAGEKDGVYIGTPSQSAYTTFKSIDFYSNGGNKGGVSMDDQNNIIAIVALDSYDIDLLTSQKAKVNGSEILTTANIGTYGATAVWG